MLELQRKLAAASVPAEKDLYRRQIESTDRQIDALAYELRPKEVPEANAKGIRVDGGGDGGGGGRESLRR